jgi:hypothetical protein
MRDVVAQSFEDLAHALRVLLEARLGANALFTVDYAEAVGNIESGLSRVLDSFHSLYDAMDKEGIGDRVDWYATPELCAILVLRNARHHNLRSKVRTIFRYHDTTVDPPTAKKMYLMMSFPPGEEDAGGIDVPLSLGDFEDLLKLPLAESRLRKSTASLMEDYLSLPVARRTAESAKMSVREVVFDVIPLIVNAGIALHPHIKDRVRHLSTESKYFDLHFANVFPAKMKSPEFTPFPFFRPEGA